MNTPLKKILSLEDQKRIFDQLIEKAEYTDQRNLTVERMIVADENSIWLQNAEGFFAQLVEALPIAVYIKDEHSNFTYINAKGRDMLNFNEKLIIGQKDADVLTDQKAVKIFSDQDDQVRDQQRKLNITEEWRNESGELVVNRTVRYPILKQVNGEMVTVGVTSIADDLTWKQKALVGREIVHMITHDWVTDLLKDLDVGLQDSSDPELKERSEIFNFVMEYLENLPIYYEADIASERLKKSLKICALKSSVFGPMVRLMRYYQKRDKYWTVPDVHDFDREITIKCNPIFLKILTYQQIKNHLKYGTSKTQLSIIAHKTPESPDYSIVYRSPGKAIVDEKVKRFEHPFYGFDDTKMYSDDGHFQIGLFICKKIAQLHNGTFKYHYDQKAKENCFTYNLKDFANTYSQ